MELLVGVPLLFFLHDASSSHSYSAAATTSTAFAQFNEADRQKVETIAQKVLKDTGVPSASVAIAMNGKIAYEGRVRVGECFPREAG